MTPAFMQASDRLEKAFNAVAYCQIKDKKKLLSLVEKARSKVDKQPDKLSYDTVGRDITEIQESIEKSIRKCDQRKKLIPRVIPYPSSLPISSKSDEIRTLLSSNQTLIVAGDTGSGKTTQLPKICLNAGFGVAGLIGHTQPRRLAAISVANRISEELGLGESGGVAHQVRFADTSDHNSFLKLMTDGILLAEIANDPDLLKYEVIIVDEAHERSLNIDFIIGYLHQLVIRRPDLKLIITSATIDVEKFSAHFDNAPIVSVSGRSYPVEVLYHPIEEVGTSEECQKLAVKKAIDVIYSESSDDGDILIFFASEREIRATLIFLQQQKFTNTECLPLFGRLTYAEQNRIFKRGAKRRIILSTNVAETSITVPGINYVIDLGTARISRYNVNNKVQRLPIEPISQASANQRKGRCGRLANGLCIRLYSEEEFDNRQEFTDPEIKRTNLASVLLRMLAYRVGRIEDFPFLEPPEAKAVKTAFKLLYELNAITKKKELTIQGKKMANLPIDARFSRMLIFSSSMNCLREVIILVSALSIQDPREEPENKRDLVRERRADLSDKNSDFLSFVLLWKELERQRKHDGNFSLSRFCKFYFLSYARLNEWQDLYRQLLSSVKKTGLKINSTFAGYEAFHKCVLSGFYDQIAFLDRADEYVGIQNKRFSLLSSSSLKGNKPKWIVSGPQIETSRIFTSLAAKIDAEWIEEIAIHLVKRNYSDPHWSKKKEDVYAYEQISLHGLRFIHKRAFRFSEIDIPGARALFIQHALVNFEVKASIPFLEHNKNLIVSLEKTEEKLRRPNFIINERDIFSFYEEQIPLEICSVKSLTDWLKEVDNTQAQSLYMSRSSFMAEQTEKSFLSVFPDTARVQNNNLAVNYSFEPGADHDGATIEVPISLLPQLKQSDLDWAIPGLVTERCQSLIRGLPKILRKGFVPINRVVEELLEGISYKDGPLLQALIKAAKNYRNITLTYEDLNAVSLPAHLSVKVRVLDHNAEQIAFGVSVDQLKSDLEVIGSLSPQRNDSESDESFKLYHPIVCDRAVDWDFGDFPDHVTLGDSLKIIRYPCVLDYGEYVAIELLADSYAAIEKSRFGFAKLFMLRTVKQKNYLSKKFAKFVKEFTLMVPVELTSIARDAVCCCYLETFHLNHDFPKSKETFDHLLFSNKERLVTTGDELERKLRESFLLRKKVLNELTKAENKMTEDDIRDVKTQIYNLFCPNFVVQAGLEWLAEYPRYLNAILIRLQKIIARSSKNAQYTDRFLQYQLRFQKLVGRDELVKRREVTALGWMVEEYRVSCYAQHLRTKMSVSDKKLEKAFVKLE